MHRPAPLPARPLGPVVRPVECRPRQWKYQLQAQVSDRFGLTVTVCHYPTGCSKWNPIEHRLFSQISQNWAGVPLRTFETVIRYITGTVTAAGLKVTALLKRGGNERGERVSDDAMQRLRLTPHAVCPTWNYTISPNARPSLCSGQSPDPSRRLLA